MNTSIVLALDKRRTKANGTSAILLRIIHYGASVQIYTGISIPAKDWDEKMRSIKSSYKGTQSVTRLNNILQKKKTEANDLILKLDEKKKLTTLSLQQIKQLIEGKTDSISFFVYAKQQIDALLTAKRIGNARAYESGIRALKAFSKAKDLTFAEIDYAFLVRMETEHLAKGNSYNSLSSYLRAVRAIYNLAIKEGLVEQELYPFKKYEIKSNKTQKRAISYEAIQKIEALDLPPGHNLFHTRNYFLLSFKLRGMNFADLAFLKVENIVDGRVQYMRRKENKPYSVKISESAAKIFAHYLKDKKPTDFVLPIITRSTVEEQYNDLIDRRRRHNKKLKELAVLCGIEANLTTYVSRHSFATRAKNLGIGIDDISTMLGHANLETTEIYIADLPNYYLDEAQDKVAGD